MRTKVVRKVHRELKEVRCVGCAKAINQPFFYTGTVIHGVGFAKRHYEELSPVIGYIETPFGNHIIGGQVEHKTKSFGFLRKSKGPICDECASDFSTVETKDGWLPRVKTDASEGTLGVLRIPEVEREFDAVVPKGPTPTSEGHARKDSRPLNDGQDNHWLNVGRVKRMRMK